MRSKYIAIVLAGVLVANACATLKPTASSVSSPDYNQRVTVSSPSYVASRSVVSYLVDFGLPVAGAVGGWALGPVVTATPEGVAPSAAGSAALGALVGTGLTYLSTKISGYGNRKEVTDIDRWLRGAQGKDYIVLSWNGSTLRVIDPSAEMNYTVKNFTDVEDFATAFPGSSYTSRVVEQAISVCGKSRESMLRLEQLFPNASNMNDIHLATLRSCSTFSQIDEYLRRYPELKGESEAVYANAVSTPSEAQIFHTKFPSSGKGALVVRNAFRKGAVSQEDAVRLYKTYGYDAFLAASGSNLTKEQAQHLAEGIMSAADCEWDDKDKNKMQRGRALTKKAADLGLPEAQYYYALMTTEQDQLDVALSYLEKAAQADYAPAAEVLVDLKNDNGPRPDKSGWLKWTNYLANQGSMPYQKSLADYYRKEKNGTEFVRWMRKLLEEHGESQLKEVFSTASLGTYYWNLGIVLYEGQMNATQNKSDGEKWIRKAAELQHEKALSWCSEHGSAEDRIKYLQDRAKKGDTDAMFELAGALKTYKGRSKASEAEAWLVRASTAGHVYAKSRLADWYASGDYLSKNETKALALYKEVVSLTGPSSEGLDYVYYAADANSVGRLLYKMDRHAECVQWYNTQGCTMTSSWYYKGLSHTALKQYPQAFTCYKTAYEKGSKDAAFELAYCYVYGRGVTKDLHKAEEIAQKLFPDEDENNYESKYAKVVLLLEAISNARK